MHVILNPASQSGKGYRIWNTLAPLMEERGVPYELHLTQGAGDAGRFAAQAEEKGDHDLLLLGGDGTLNDMIQDLCHPEEMTIGYIPAGSSNDFARHFAPDKDPVKALYRILDRVQPRTVDIGEVTYLRYDEKSIKTGVAKIPKTRRFLVSCGIGFDAGVCEEAMDSRTKDFLNKIKLGKLTYGSIALHQIREAGKYACDYAIDGVWKHVDRLLFVVGMNTRFEGGGFMFCPEADPGDGKIDMCLVDGLTTGEFLTALPGAFKGGHVTHKGVTVTRGTTLQIKTEAPLWVHTDGEVLVMASEISMQTNKDHTTVIL